MHKWLVFAILTYKHTQNNCKNKGLYKKNGQYLKKKALIK